MSPRGRRPGGPDTRAAILESAREEFAAKGYDATSLRGIARAAEVDPALVHHYFDGKADLFAQVVAIPVDPQSLIDGVIEGPIDGVGERLARAFFSVWERPGADLAFQALIRSASSTESAARALREFVGREIFGRVAIEVAERSGRPVGADVEARIGAAAGQVLGVAMLRYVVRFPALVEAEVDDLIDLVAPTLQRYLVG